ncbi:MAG: tRNA (adenosine(37)-N6)-threonylcarbamoyltransferase complex ATPase subunit type 1 TsaE [Litoreibacter sp.]
MEHLAPPNATLHARHPEDTQNWAQRLADQVQPGDVICLWGDVGAGKTFFARSLIQTLQAQHGAFEDVPSPTFTLVQTYLAGSLEIWHADLYRLGGPDEVIELGLAAAFDTALCLIEWPDRLGELMPETAMHMTFTTTQSEDARDCKLSCSDSATLTRYARCLGAQIDA